MSDRRQEQHAAPSNLSSTCASESERPRGLDVDPTELLAAIIADSDDAIISMSVEGIITSFNPGAERMYGYRADEVIGKHLKILLPPDGIDEFPAIMARLRCGERIDHYETVRRRKDGTLIDVSVSISPLRDMRGEIIGASKVARDITHRKQTERALLEQSRIMERLNSVGQVLGGELDIERLVQAVTDAGTEISGADFGAFFYNLTNEKGDQYTLFTISGVAREAFAKFPMPRATEVFAPTFKGEGIVRSDDITKDARYAKNAPYRGMPKGHLPVRSYLAVPVISRTGKVLGGLFFGHQLAGVFTANHEQLIAGLAAQAAIAIDNAQLFKRIAEQQQELQLVTDAMPALVSYIDYDLRYQFNNKTYEEWFGRSRDEIRGMHVREVLGEQAYQKLRPHFEAALQGQTVSYETVAPYNRVGPRHIQATYIPHHDSAGKVAGMYVMVIDVTERMKQEQQLRDSELRLRQALEAGKMGAWELDVATGKVSWSQELEALHGLEPGTFAGTLDAFQAVIKPEDRDLLSASIQDCIGSQAQQKIEYRIVRPDGSMRWIECRGQMFENALHQPQRMVGVCTDITAEKKFEEDLLRSEEQYRASFELAAVGKAQLDPTTGQFLRVNRKLTELVGYSQQELLALTFSQIVHREDHSVQFDEYQRLVRGEVAELAGEFRLVRRDGDIVWVHVNATIVRSADQRPLHAIFVIQDVSDRKRAEAELVMHREQLENLITQRTKELEESHERLRLSERMAALGTLSAGLGHDMGNLLLPLRLRMDAMETKGVSPDIREDLEAIRKCAEYLQRLANGLRLFALDPDSSDTAGNSTNLHEWWPDVHSFFKNALPRHVVLEPRFPADLPAVRLARPNLTQAIFNLVQNAGDVMKSRPEGSIVISAESIPEKGMIRIGVTDDGPGMTAEVKRRCLEPFYTTKTRAISTGLGLALVHGIVQKAGGTIDIESRVGQGTTFVLELPAVPDGFDSLDANRNRLTACVRLQDDRMRAYVSSVLASLGYDVICNDSTPHPSTTIWVTDQITNGSLEEYVNARNDRHVLAIGVSPKAAHPHVLTTSDPNPKPAALRQLLREMAGRHVDGGPDSGNR